MDYGKDQETIVRLDAKVRRLELEVERLKSENDALKRAIKTPQTRPTMPAVDLFHKNDASEKI